MSVQALSYILSTNLLSNEKLKVFYDFNTGSTFLVQSGSYYKPYLKNITPSYNTGKYHAEIYGLQNTDTGTINFYLTGQYGFLEKNGSGDLSRFNAVISGQPDFNFNDCSMLFNFSNEKYSNGILFGSFQKTEDVINDVVYKGSKGFNFGINDRGKLFFQSLSDIGEYIFTANNIELSKKNIVSLSVGSNEVQISRFDYLNNDIQTESFHINTDYVKNSELLYIGSSPNYYSLIYPLQPTFDGYISNLAIFSGNLASQFLYDFGSGLLSTYYYNTGQVTGYSTITGYTTTPLYATGVTGYITGVTGYRSVLTGSGNYLTGGFSLSGTSSKTEGSKIFNYYSGSGISYKEEIGFLSSAYSGTYNPTGLNAFDTLGLQNISQNVNIYNEQSGVYNTYVNVPLYGVTALTGYTTEITGYTQVPLTGTVYETGVANSGVSMNGTLSEEFKKDYIYYLGERPTGEKIDKLTNGLMAHWKLDEVSGIRYDSTENNYDLTPYTELDQVAGFINQAASNYELASYLYNEDLTLAGSTEFTIAFWVKHTDVVGEESLNELAGIWRGGNSTYSEFIIAFGGLGQFDSTGANTIGLKVLTDIDDPKVLSPLVDLDGGWRLCVFRFISGNKIELIIDNGSAISGEFATMGTISPINNPPERVPFRLLDGGDGYALDGPLDSFSIWNRALTDSEINKLWNNGFGLDYESFDLPERKYELIDELVAHWKLDETSGTRYDSVGNAHLAIGSLDLSEVQVIQGIIGNAADFNEKTYLRADYLLPLRGRQCSFSVWIKSTINYEFYTYSEYVLVVLNAPIGFYITGDGHLAGQASQGGADERCRCRSTIAINDGQWHHMVITSDGNIQKMYIDGILNTTGGSNPPDQEFDISATILDQTQGFEDVAFYPILFNTTLDEYGNIQDFGISPCSLDSFSVWNRNLTATEVIKLYNNGEGIDLEQY